MSFDSPLPPYTLAGTTSLLSSSAYDFLLLELPHLCVSLCAKDIDTKVALRELDNPELLESLFHRLSSIGHRVGYGLAEKFSRERPRMLDTLEVIKFVCKELWGIAWGKMVDGLKTNHRGVYVLTDNNFRVLTRMSTEKGGKAVERAQPFLWFPCGVIRGALAGMGVEATVHAESLELPIAIFKIETTNTGKPPV